MNSPPLSMIIPNWNGAALLRQYLPSVVRELEDYNPSSECIVVDDGSTDDSFGVLQRQFPTVRAVRLEQNRGFSSAMNAGIEAAQNELLLFLNNDVALQPGAVAAMVATFVSGEDVFGVTAVQVVESDGENLRDGFQTLSFQSGHYLQHNRTQEILAGKEGRLGFLSGGCCLCSRAKVRSIGGFSTLFDPFYYEDTELSLQAAKRGWRLLFARESVVHHYPGNTSQRKRWAVRFLPVRNLFILHWLTLDDGALWLRHILHIGHRLFWWSLHGRLRYAAGFFLALLKLPQVIRERRRRSRDWRIKLREILPPRDNADAPAQGKHAAIG